MNWIVKDLTEQNYKDIKEVVTTLTKIGVWSGMVDRYNWKVLGQNDNAVVDGISIIE